MALTAALVTACSGANQLAPIPYNTDQSVAGVEDGVIAENDSFQLLWDNTQKCIFFYQKSTQKIWCSIPYNYYNDPGSGNLDEATLTSPITVNYVEPVNKQLKTLYAATDAVQKGRVECKKIENGLEVIYYFDAVKISIPVEYILRNDSLEARIDVGKISEGDNIVYQVSLLPFFSAVQNNTENSYLFVPDGSGALMNTDEGKRNARTFIGAVYGDDPSQRQDQKLVYDESVKLPVFGVKDGSSALCGVIEKGDELASINAQAGDPYLGYSSVYASFQLRGFDTMIIPDLFNKKQVSPKYSKRLAAIDYVSVGYYPLEGDQADYNGMAKVYSNYLVKNRHMSSQCTDTQLNVELLGGVLERAFFFGIPYDQVMPATTFAQAKNIIGRLEDVTKEKPVVKLTGFGQSALDVGKVAGGYGFGGAMGGNSGYKTLSAYCSENGVPLFTDFDLVQFRKSGNGFSSFFNAASTPNNIPAKQNIFSLATLAADTNQYSFELLKRAMLPEAAQKLLNKRDGLGLTGVSFSSLSRIAYSDYSQTQYYNKGNMLQDVTDVFQKFRTSGSKVMSTESNAYAAATSDYIAGSPTSSGGNDAFDMDIPFYQMVFKGYIPISVSPINLAKDPQTQFLKAIQTGSALNFSLSSEASAKFAQSTQSALLASCYDDNEATIVQLVDQSKDYYQQVQTAKITSYRMLDSGISETVFDNNVRVYVNLSEKTLQLPDGTELQPSSFKYGAE